MSPTTVLSTDEIAPRERGLQWSEWIWRHFGGLQSDLYGDDDFDGHLAASRAGDVILTRLEANRHRVVRTPTMARTSEVPYLKIVAPWQGSAIVHQQSREACARNGAWVIYDTTGAYEIDNPERVDHLIVMVPLTAVQDRKLRIEGLMARPLGASGISRVALETMRNTYLELPNMSEQAARGAGETIKQLVELSLLELAGRETMLTQREALRDRIRSHVQRHLGDPGLCVDSIARTLNCSRRHLYNAFAGEGETIAAYIQRMRLEACIRELRQRAGPERPITEIATSWGFGNPSHFSRLFRGHTGMSPTEFRRGG
ncbi:helix-turn-helix domain-containing protein [Ramlibacter solisilvae]|uniref:DNA-binding protein n=1 Tax=Ramlibacter tataouinensis TaxID=94132 RepID=A0A127JXV9_9BURK|nr:helix-turn-helix domain-containing protein [Ramlibacter tataouinensis]AMO24693.1 DNA-binding protein [Ramlibacter tataouinensis]